MSSHEADGVDQVGRIAPGLDEIDQRILGELVDDGRLPVRELAERVNVSRANAYSRIERLKRSGVLTGFKAVVDPTKAGLATSAYVTLSVRQKSWRDLSAQLRHIPEVKHIALVGGDFDVMLLVRTTDNEQLRHVVLNQLQEIPGVLGTRTYLIFDDIDTE